MITYLCWESLFHKYIAKTNMMSPLSITVIKHMCLDEDTAHMLKDQSERTVTANIGRY